LARLQAEKTFSSALIANRDALHLLLGEIDFFSFLRRVELVARLSFVSLDAGAKGFVRIPGILV
jgi:hypothetical protein